MKRKSVIALALAAAMTAGLAGCGSSSSTTGDTAGESTEESAQEEAEEETEEETAEEETGETTDEAESTASVTGDYEYIFVCPIVGLEYWDMCADGMGDADADIGTSTQVVGSSDSSTALTDMVSYMESAISAQPDGIITYCGLEFMPTLIEQAAEQGIPVLAIDSDAEDTSRIAYVGTDPENAGYSSGEAMIEATGGTAKVAVLCSSLSAEKEMTEIEAFEQAVADAGADIEIIAMEETGGDLATGVTKMQSLVQTYDEMTAVLCTSAYDVQAAAKVKEEMGLDDLVLIGYDDQDETLEYIREGLIDAIVVQDPYTMGYLAVQYMTEYLNNGSLDQESYDTGTILVTIDNVDTYND